MLTRATFGGQIERTRLAVVYNPVNTSTHQSSGYTVGESAGSGTFFSSVVHVDLSPTCVNLFGTQLKVLSSEDVIGGIRNGAARHRI